MATILALAATPAVSDGPETGEDSRRVRARAEWFRSLRRGPDGLIPHRARLRALEQLDGSLRDGSLRLSGRSPVQGVWSSVGPDELVDGAASYSGRVTSLAVHPGDPDIVYVGTAQGGVWKTTDGGVSWAPLTDGEASLAVGSITLDPSDPDTVYVGTGEPYDSCSTYFGVGVLRSGDGGATWTLLGSQELGGTSVSRIIVHPQDPDTLWVANAQGWAGFVCTEAPDAPAYGVHKSTDGGATWTLVLGSGQSGAPSHVYDLVIDPSDPDVLYAAVDGSGVWKTVDGGGGWDLLSGGLPAGGFGRIDLAVDPNDGQTIYAAFERATNRTYLGTWKSTDGGATWLSLPPVPAGATCQVSTFRDPCTYEGQSSGLCNYALYVEVAPSGTLWLGGVVLWRSPDGGFSWIDSCPVDMHVDQHAAAFAADGRVWVGNDGGVFVSADGGATWSARNRGLVTAQFYPGVSVHPAGTPLMLAGTQDNGTRLFSGGGAWTLLLLGDGAFSAIDTVDPDNTWYLSRQYLSIFKTTNAGLGVAPASTGLVDAGRPLFSPFIAPLAMCPASSSVLVAGSDNVWRTDDGAAGWVPNSPDPLAGFLQHIRTIAFDPSDPTCTTYFAGLAAGSVYRTTSGGGPSGWTDISAGLPGAGVSDLAVHPADGNIVVAALSGFGTAHVFKTTNALASSPTWQSVSAGLPDTPVDSVLIDPDDGDVVFVGTDVGIFRSEDGGLTWGPVMDGHPKVAVYDLVTDPSTGDILSFTYGRGVFRLACDHVPCGAVGSTLLVGHDSGDAVLSWGEVTCGDLAGYAVYGSAAYDAPFPEGWTLLGTPAGATIADPLGSAHVVYRVVSIDRCGNVSAD